MKKVATPKNTNVLIQKTSDKKKATLKNTKWLIQKTSNGQKDNHSKNLVQHQKLANQHSNLKGVSSQDI
jgi:hypothetical protein